MSKKFNDIIEELAHHLRRSSNSIFDRKKVSSDDLVQSAKEIVESIKVFTCDHMRQNYDEVFTKRRFHELVECRQIAMWLTHKYYSPEFSLKSIGRLFKRSDTGKSFDHSTVIHAIETINNRIETERLFKSRIDSIVLDYEKRFITN